MRSRPVSAPAIEGHVHRVDIGECKTRGVPQAARRQRRIHVKRQGKIGAWKVLEETVGHHVPGSLAHLFGGLGDHQQGAPPLGAQFAKQARRGDKVGHVHVVPAGVHDPGGAAIGQSRRDFARVLEPGFLAHGQRIHVAANQERGAGPILQQPHHPGPPHTGTDRVARLRQGAGHHKRRLGLLVRELGVRVEVTIKFEQVLKVLFRPGVHSPGIGPGLAPGIPGTPWCGVISGVISGVIARSIRRHPGRGPKSQAESQTENQNQGHPPNPRPMPL